MTAEATKFVIQEHKCDCEVHWDLMLESGDVLETYSLEKHPSDIYSGPIKAVKIYDHHKKYLIYEGPVQNNTGKVRIVDSGKYTVTNQKTGVISLEFNGEILNGPALLSINEDGSWYLSISNKY